MASGLTLRGLHSGRQGLGYTGGIYELSEVWGIHGEVPVTILLINVFFFTASSFFK